MTTQLFNGSSLLLQDDLLHEIAETSVPLDIDGVPLDRLAASLRRAFTAFDNQGALLVIELDNLKSMQPERQAALLDHVVTIARSSIRRTDILERLGPYTIAIALPGSGRIGMTRVADALRQRVEATTLDDGTTLSTTVTIGAVHTTESKLADLDELLLAAQVNLDAARAVGGNRTNWTDL